MATCDNPERCQDACAERCRNEIRRREVTAEALVVFWCVRLQLRVGRAMNGSAAEIAFVGGRDGDHAASVARLLVGRKNFVGALDRLKSFGRFFLGDGAKVGLRIRVKFSDEFAVATADLFGGGVDLQAKR